ncbi:MAG: amidohydrolase family protein [Gammaproteobacteria bacterium]
MKKHFGQFAIATLLFSLIIGAANADGILISNVTVIDGTGRAPVVDAFVLVEDEMITRIATSPLAAPDGVRIVDGDGKFLVPGLMDLHIHLMGGTEVDIDGLRSATIDREKGLRALHSYIYAGVTSVFDSGNNPEFIFGLRKDERDGAIMAPRIFATGSIVTYPGSHGSSDVAVHIDDWPEGIPILDAYLDTEPDVVKLTFEERGWGARETIPMFPLPLMQTVIEYLNDAGVRTVVHTSSERRARQAMFAGIDNLAHPVIQGPVTAEFAALMGAKKVPMVTTLTIGENYSRLAEQPEYLDQPLYRAVLTADEIEELKTVTRKEYQERTWTWWMKIMTEVAQENVFKIHEAGGLLCAGSDQTRGTDLHRELELLADAGISNLDIIRIATLNCARFLGREDDLGSIEAGKLADMVLVDADPVADINNLKKISAVIKGGQLVDRSKLDLPVNQ